MFATAAVQITACRGRCKSTRFSLSVNLCFGNLRTLAAAEKGVSVDGRRPLSDSRLCSAHVFFFVPYACRHQTAITV